MNIFSPVDDSELWDKAACPECRANFLDYLQNHSFSELQQSFSIRLCLNCMQRLVDFSCGLSRNASHWFRLKMNIEG